MNGQYNNRYNDRRVSSAEGVGYGRTNTYGNQRPHTEYDMNRPARPTNPRAQNTHTGGYPSNGGKNSGGNGRFYLIAVLVCIAIVGLSVVAGMAVASRRGKSSAPASDTAAPATTETSAVSSSADTTAVPDTEETKDTYTVPNVTFKSNLDEYEKYMNPTGDDRDGYLLLVNASNTLDKNNVPEDLTNIANTRSDGRNTQQLRLYAAKALDALFIEMKAEGYKDVSVTSGYRSYSYQQSLFSDYTSREMAADSSLSKAQAEAIVVTYSSRPGTSEHQSGLCIDMHNLSQADTAFAKTKAYDWLVENSWKFGFVLRYPEDKTNVTGISFEPWHYRYVGRYHAAKMHETGLCLEEYIAQLKK